MCSVPSFVLFELSTVMARILRWPQASQPLAYHSSRMSPPLGVRVGTVQDKGHGESALR